MTKWVGQAWQEISASLQELINAVFKSIGISLPADESEDDLVKLCGLPEYRITRGGAAAEEPDVRVTRSLARAHPFLYLLSIFSLSCRLVLPLALSLVMCLSVCLSFFF